MNIDDLKKDILEYDLYEVLDDIPYSNYFLTILNENDKIMIVVRDDEGSATGMMTKDEFLNIGTTEMLKKHINAILYYNYIEYERE